VGWVMLGLFDHTSNRCDNNKKPCTPQVPAGDHRLRLHLPVRQEAEHPPTQVSPSGVYKPVRKQYHPLSPSGYDIPTLSPMTSISLLRHRFLPSLFALFVQILPFYLKYIFFMIFTFFLSRGLYIGPTTIFSSPTQKIVFSPCGGTSLFSLYAACLPLLLLFCIFFTLSSSIFSLLFFFLLFSYTISLFLNFFVQVTLASISPVFSSTYISCFFLHFSFTIGYLFSSPFHPPSPQIMLADEPSFPGAGNFPIYMYDCTYTPN
jgi:hypothetical protein